MSFKLTGIITVYRKDFEDSGRPTYSYCISEKKENGEFERAYRNLKFKKGIELQNKTKIKVTNAWEKAWNGKSYVFVSEFEEVAPDGFEYAQVDEADLPW